MENVADKAVKAAPEAEAVAFDIDSLNTIEAANKGIEVPLRHDVSNRLLGLFVGVLGRDSDVFQGIVNDRRNEAIQQAALANKSGRDMELKTAEELDERGLELLIACTTHFRTELKNAKGETVGEKPAILCKGEWLTFNVPNAKRLYREYPWMRKQVDNAIGDISLFIKP